MGKRKTFTIYTHHFQSLQVEFPNRRSSAGRVFFGKIGRGLYQICYIIGRAVAWPFVQVLRFLKFLSQEPARTGVSFRKRLRQARTQSYTLSLGLFFIFCFAIFGIFQSARLVAWGLQVKDSVINLSGFGNRHITQAVTEVKDQDFSSARDEFAKAYATFQSGSQQLQNSNRLVNELSNVIPQKRAASNLLQAATLLSQAGGYMVDFIQMASTVHMSPQGLTGSTTAASLTQAQNDVQQTLALVNQAVELTRAIKPSDVPASYRDKLAQLQDQSSVLLTSLQNLNDLLDLGNSTLLGDKQVLLLFLNNNELRPGGGFIGTYGAMHVIDGKIEGMHVSSIYDLDGQLQDSIAPPQPMLAVNNRWYLRDSNWFADFPLSANKATDFYEREAGYTPDIIIAMTPNLILDLLKVTGPVQLPDFNVTLTPNNFVEQTQAVTTISDNAPVNHPKEMLAVLVPTLLQKIAALPASSTPAILDALQTNLNEKQIVLYSRDPKAEQKFAAYNWSGQILDTDRDYLSVVSANLSGTKTDLSIDQNMSLGTNIAPDGSVVDDLTITRTNHMQKMDGSENSSFIRVLVPQGSQLLSETGFDSKDLSGDGLKNAKVDPDVQTWAQTITQQPGTGTYIGQESGKTFFGNWLTLSGGESKTIRLVYRLPFKLKNVDHYGLLLQKQIGSLNFPMSWTLNFGNRTLAWKNFGPGNLQADQFSDSILLDHDQFFGIVFSNK